MTFGEFLNKMGLEAIDRTRDGALLEEEFKSKLESIDLEMGVAAYHFRRKETK